LFQKFWWPLSLPAALMLLTAVWVRVNEYGFTPQRLLLLGIVVWSVGLALWFGFGPKEKRDIRLIPGAAAGLLCAAAFSASWISQHSQGARFERNLIASGIMDASGKIPAEPQITDLSKAAQAKGALQYLMRRGGAPKAAMILEGSGADFDAKETTLNVIIERLGLKAVSKPNRSGIITSRKFRRDKSNPITIVGFDKIFAAKSLGYTGRLDSREKTLFDQGTLKVTQLDGKARFVTGELEVYFDFKAWVEAQNFGPQDIKGPIAPITVVDTAEQGISLIIERLNLTTRQDGEDRFSVSFYTLTRGID
jgi:hypothetical protein